MLYIIITRWSLGKLSATKSIANKTMTSPLTGLLTATDSLPIRGEYTLWIYRNYILSLLRFHIRSYIICVDAITNQNKNDI